MGEVLPQLISIHQYLVKSYGFALIKCNSLARLVTSFPAILNMPWFLTKQQVRTAHTNQHAQPHTQPPQPAPATLPDGGEGESVCTNAQGSCWCARGSCCCAHAVAIIVIAANRCHCHCCRVRRPHPRRCLCCPCRHCWHHRPHRPR